ncbi:MAG: hypothetical protein ACWA5A_09055 [Marinibacterium sp.]
MRLTEKAQRGMTILAAHFHQDWHLMEQTVEITAKHAAFQMSPEDCAALSAAISKALAEGQAIDLRNPFRRAGSDIIPAKPSEQAFWSRVLDGLLAQDAHLPKGTPK